MSARQHHLQCERGEIAPVVLLPGDPARATLIASFLDEVTAVADAREFRTYTGAYRGNPVSVTSTGIGCPSTAIAVEELVRLGARTLVRVGTAGAVSAHVEPGDLVVATGAIRDEGTTTQYLPLAFPAVADLALASELAAAAARTQRRVHVGVMHTKDSFYGQKQPETMPMADELRRRWSAWRAAGALCSEMETSALFVVAAVRAVSAGSICLVASSADGERRLAADAAKAAVEDAIVAALEAVVAAR